MQPSLTLCRTQEAQQRSRAAMTTLDNVRQQANAAAAAWAKEGALAEKREARKELARTEAGLPLEMVDDMSDDDMSDGERGFSENPDRGFSEFEDDQDQE